MRISYDFGTYTRNTVVRARNARLESPNDGVPRRPPRTAAHEAGSSKRKATGKRSVSKRKAFRHRWNSSAPGTRLRDEALLPRIHFSIRRGNFWNSEKLFPDSPPGGRNSLFRGICSFVV